MHECFSLGKILLWIHTEPQSSSYIPQSSNANLNGAGELDTIPKVMSLVCIYHYCFDIQLREQHKTWENIINVWQKLKRFYCWNKSDLSFTDKRVPSHTDQLFHNHFHCPLVKLLLCTLKCPSVLSIQIIPGRACLCHFLLWRNERQMGFSVKAALCPSRAVEPFEHTQTRLSRF